MKNPLDHFRNAGIRWALITVLAASGVLLEQCNRKMQNDTSERVSLVLSPQERKIALNDTIQQIENLFRGQNIPFEINTLEAGNGILFHIKNMRISVFQLHPDLNDSTGQVHFHTYYEAPPGHTHIASFHSLKEFREMFLNDFLKNQSTSIESR